MFKNLIQQTVNFSKRQKFVQSHCKSQNNINNTIKNLNSQIPKNCFFWTSKTPEQQEAEKKKLAQNSNRQTKEQWQNIGHIIEDMKKANQNKPKLLADKQLKYQDKLTVFVEMDEVLAYVFSPDEFETYMSAPERDYDFLYEYKDYDTYLSIYKRPHLDEFLKYLRENTEPVLYCTGVKSYVESVMKFIDPENSFQHIICQEDGCTQIINEDENIDDFIKDLNLMNRDLTRSVYLDSKALNFWSNPDNAIPVQEYMADSTINDTELLKIIDTLEELKNEKDVRDILNEKFEIRKALEDSKML